MNKGIVNKIMVLVAIFALGGCSSIATQSTGQNRERPILSAAEAQSMIRVTVTTPDLAPKVPSMAALTD